MRNIRLEVLRRVAAFLLVFFIAGIGFGLSGCSSKKDNQAGTVGSAEVQSTAVADDMAFVSYTHLRAHETDSYLVCRLLLEKKKKNETGRKLLCRNNRRKEGEMAA